MRKINKTLIFILGMQYSVASLAQSSSSELTVLPFAGPNMSDVIVDSNMSFTHSSSTNLQIFVSCYGTNLRSVSNPVSPNSDITATIKFQGDNNAERIYKVTFPALATTKSSSVNQDLTNNSRLVDVNGVEIEKLKAQLTDGVIKIDLRRSKTVGLDVLAAGADFGKIESNLPASGMIKSIQFSQQLRPGVGTGQYMGHNGALSGSMRWYASENGKSISVYASFPGQNRFCGGYFSPLMLNFENDSVPKLSKSSTFPLLEADLKNKVQQKISWPQFPSGLYFLVNDLNGNRKADHGGELFGDINGYANGFENLAVYDRNRDKVIDEQDEIFKKLFLWRDANEDGITQKNEVVSLKDLGVQSISLEFENKIFSEAHRGRVLGPGSFQFKGKDGMIKRGKVWDVFLTALPE